MTRFLILIIATLFLSHCKDNSETDKYRVGQEWNYKTRPGEENSTPKILKIEESYRLYFHLSTFLTRRITRDKPKSKILDQTIC